MIPFMAFVKNLTNAPVHCLQIGSEPWDDAFNGWLMNANSQLEYACVLLAGISGLDNGFIGMGLSQGGLYIRGLLQRCPAAANMKRLISIGGPQEGVQSVPKCDGNSTVCQLVSRLLDIGIYDALVQDIVSPADYWHYSLDESSYLKYCIFLPDINNELAQKNQTYKQRIVGLDHFVMVQFTQDTVIFPRISESFGYFANGSVTDVLPLKKTAQYQQDWLGLRTLDQQGKLTFLSCPTDHLHFTHQWFIANLLPYLV